ncbi:succinate dehydrogenase/fumarate reductase flavo protein subunit [Dendrothele bispora CBS 962.96]|uniref:Succinate dehydrogenase/fumarate reductase flavo protein subunit n=1 Tax=Dendrothele bispora (strain CBS 962.96) TaxID=1314807 RepID=A0A4S8M9P6_DENBC|nr:succinate dehydrogenase/fumarate reductase flavo protein subunit [Dendrothele bispora CBS 962.96]
MQSAYDLVVVGSGFAGCMTTLKCVETAKKLGKSPKVLLVEAGIEEERPGASRWTQAFLRLDKDLNFDKRWPSIVHKTSRGLADMEYCNKLVEIAGPTAKYVESLGVELMRIKEDKVALEFDTDGVFVRPHGGGVAIVRTLLKEIGKYPNAQMVYETVAEKLLTDETGNVNGVRVRTKDGVLHNIRSPNVMLACGGFEANKEMLTAYIGNNAVDLPLIAPGLKHNKGAGIRMAMEVGAATSGAFDGIHTELVDTRSKQPDAVVWGNGYGILVDENCKRFFNEAHAELFGSFELAAYHTWKDCNQKSWFIFDKTTYDFFKPGWVYDTTDLEPEQGATIGELAGKLGLDPHALQQTVNEFNTACDTTTPLNFLKLDGKGTKGINPPKSNWAQPIISPPFYGYPLTANLTFTYGGLATNLNAQVLAQNGSVIPGLYAAGEIHGVFYHEYPPASSVLRSLSFGGVAGEFIARNKT